ncbi:hypothetical protein [Nocardioides gilvus]|uniref:hypothetical protein n=1 Tax=Nocardioides gilvus TaxID=1735589 RepID=UPI000D743346|nr:hypothetical protein [Nocardioides gilvus]
MTYRDEDALWRSIVENYGDRAELDDELDPGPQTARAESAAGTSEPYEAVDAGAEVAGPEPPEESGTDDEARFVPPVPPPLPSTTRPRRAAWLGVIGAPILFLLTAFTGGALGGTIALALIGVFVGSLVYLVFTMPQEPRDPWDNGARV